MLAVLDGWRGVSILLVLSSHLLPLGPKRWQLNEMAGPMGRRNLREVEPLEEQPLPPVDRLQLRTPG